MAARAPLVALLLAAAPARADVSPPPALPEARSLEESLGCPAPASAYGIGELEAMVHRDQPREDHDLRLYDLGVRLARAGRFPEARATLLELIKFSPTSRLLPDVYLVYGDFFERQGDPEMALRFFARAGDLWPNGRCAAYAEFRRARLEAMIRQDDRAQRVLERFAAGEAYPGALRRAARQTLARLYPAP